MSFNSSSHHHGSDGASPKGRTFAEWIAVLIRRWPVLVVALIVGLAVGGIYSLLQPTLYETTSTVVLSPESGAFDPSTSENLPSIAATVAGLATSNVTLLTARDAYIAAADSSDRARRQETDLKWMQSRVASTALPGTGLVEISGRDVSSDAAADLTAAVNDALVAQIRALDTASTAGQGLQVVPLGDPIDEGQVSPRTTRDLIFGANLGLLAGILFVLLTGERTTSGPSKSIAAALGVRDVAEIPPPDGATSLSLDSSRWSITPGSPVEEGLRTLRARIIGARGQGASTIALLGNPTSARLRDTAVRLGAQISSTGASTVIVEADFHGPLWTLDSSKMAGLGEALSGSSAIGHVLEIHVLKGGPNDAAPEYVDLALLPAGEAPSDLPTTFASTGFEAVIDELKESYDYVLVVGPNLQWREETEILAMTTDSTILVVEADTSADQVEALRLLTETDPSRLLGVAMITKVDHTPRTRKLSVK